MLAFDKGDYDTAESDLRAVLQSQPWNRQAHYKLAQILLRSDRKEEAQGHLDENRRLTELSNRVLELQSTRRSGTKEAERLTELADALEELGQWETAARLRRNAEQVMNSQP